MLQKFVALDAPFEYIGDYDSSTAKGTKHETLSDCQRECLRTFKCVGVLFEQASKDIKCHVLLPSDTMLQKSAKRFYRLSGLEFHASIVRPTHCERSCVKIYVLARSIGM